MDVRRVLDRDSTPSVGKPERAWCQFPQPRTTLCQHVELVPVRALHCLEYTSEEGFWEVVMKEISYCTGRIDA
jgi:hypothetical protein